MTQLQLFTPEQLGWIKSFEETLKECVASRKWMLLLHTFVKLGVYLPKQCGCVSAIELGNCTPEMHAAYNIKIRAMIQSSGARVYLFRALYRRMTNAEPSAEERAEVGGYTDPVSKEYGALLMDFLRAEPQMLWFSAGRSTMYQGKALDGQERRPELVH